MRKEPAPVTVQPGRALPRPAKIVQTAPFARLHRVIVAHPDNLHFTRRGWAPEYTASATSRILIVGQAPGRKAQESGVPWNDASGDNLRRWLDVTRDEFYDASRIALVPMDFYYPGKGPSGDLPPRPGFAPLWHPRLLALMPRIRLTILIGQYAQRYYLGDTLKRNLTETVRAFRSYLPGRLPLVHPSPLTFRWLAKNPWFAARVLPVLRRRVRAILREDR
jgi:uracil-DNA glycosylase